MNGSAHIVKRQTKSGPRWIVRYRLGGRGTKMQHGGSFRNPGGREQANRRRMFIMGEIAAGRDPRETLAETLVVRQQERDMVAWADAFIGTRTDVGKAAIEGYKNARDRLGSLAKRYPKTLTVSDLQEWVSGDLIAPENGKRPLAPKSVRKYVNGVAQFLDHAEIEPNPARSKRLRLPMIEKAEIDPPMRPEFDLMLAQLREDYVLPFEVMEACGMRIGETCKLIYGDVDWAEGKFRISAARTKGRTGGQRWLPVPPELLDRIELLLPFEDRARDRRVFDTLTEDSARRAMTNACKLAGVVDRNPHQLRHRRISLWFALGIDPITIKTWAGHAKASMSTDNYGHVMVDPQADPWAGYWAEMASKPRIREIPVRHEVEQDA